MKEFTCQEIVINLDKPALLVKHSELKRVGDSLYRSNCPECEEGVLLVKREPETFELLAEDVCMLCGRRFVYTDIQELRG